MLGVVTSVWFWLGNKGTFISDLGHLGIITMKTRQQDTWAIMIALEKNYSKKKPHVISSSFFASLFSKQLMGENIEDAGSLDSS